jgi:anti-sigma factor RsiW
MTNIARPVGEEDLQAWVDGRLTPERAGAVDAYLAAHPEQRSRLSQYSEQRQALRAAFAEQEAPIPARLRGARLTASWCHRQHRRLAQVAAAIAVLILGGVAGWAGRELVGPLGWGETTVARMIIVDAIAAHRTFAVELRHPVEVPSSQQAHLGEWLSNRLGRPLVVPDLTALGLQLMGGRLLPSEGGPAAQLMYDDGRGDRLTLYLRVGITGETTLYQEDQNVGVLYWADEGFACAIVVRPADHGRLLRIAESVYGQLLPNAPKDEFSHEAGTGG